MGAAHGMVASRSAARDRGNGPVRATAALAGRPAAAAETGTPKPYAFAQDATTVQGATGTTDAVRLEPGGTYRSSLGKDGKLHYRLELDATSNAYVAATAVPKRGAKVTYSDGVKVSVQDGNSGNCSSSTTAHFGASQSPHPIAAWASREIGPGKYACQTAGTYYVVVERTAAPVSSASPPSSPDAWDLELSYASEPRLKKAGSTSAPETWNSASPAALQGTRGHAGPARVSPRPAPSNRESGGTRSAPGRRSSTRCRSTGDSSSTPPPNSAVRAAARDSRASWARLSSCPSTTPCADSSPTRARDTTAASGRPHWIRCRPSSTTTATPSTTGFSGMRFAGSYYLVVHLAAQVAESFGDGPFGLTLRVRVDGAAQTGPAYAGRAVPGRVRLRDR